CEPMKPSAPVTRIFFPRMDAVRVAEEEVASTGAMVSVRFAGGQSRCQGENDAVLVPLGEVGAHRQAQHPLGRAFALCQAFGAGVGDVGRLAMEGLRQLLAELDDQRQADISKAYYGDGREWLFCHCGG